MPLKRLGIINLARPPELTDFCRMSFAGGMHSGPDAAHHRSGDGRDVRDGGLVAGQGRVPEPWHRKGPADQESGLARDRAHLRPSLIVTALTNYPLLTLLAALAFGVLVFGRILP